MPTLRSRVSSLEVLLENVDTNVSLSAIPHIASAFVFFPTRKDQPSGRSSRERSWSNFYEVSSISTQKDATFIPHLLLSILWLILFKGFWMIRALYLTLLTCYSELINWGPLIRRMWGERKSSDYKGSSQPPPTYSISYIFRNSSTDSTSAPPTSSYLRSVYPGLILSHKHYHGGPTCYGTIDIIVEFRLQICLLTSNILVTTLPTLSTLFFLFPILANVLEA